MTLQPAIMTRSFAPAFQKSSFEYDILNRVMCILGLLAKYAVINHCFQEPNRFPSKYKLDIFLEAKFFRKTSHQNFKQDLWLYNWYPGLTSISKLPRFFLKIIICNLLNARRLSYKQTTATDNRQLALKQWLSSYFQ